MIFSLTALTKLHVGGNPLQLPPLAVANRGLRAIRAYFDDLEAGTAIARTCMLVLLGDAEMGKTSLLNGLRNDCTPDPAPAGPDGRTIHLDIKPLSLGACLTLALALALTLTLTLTLNLTLTYP